MLSAAPLALRDLVNDRCGHTETFGDFHNALSACDAPSDCRSAFIGQLSAWMKFTFRNAPPRCVLAARVFRAVDPLQIFRSIVQTIPVEMINGSTSKRRRSMERLTDKSVGEIPISHTIKAEPYLPISILFNGTEDNLSRARLKRLIFTFRRRTKCCSAHTARAGCFHTKKPNNRLPNFAFIRQRQISHNRTPIAVGGQGRALLTQRFRPVFHAPKLAILQGGAP